MLERFKNWWDTWYMRYHDNWHKNPVISKILCWMGRHDYEADYIRVRMDASNRGSSVRLYCFYCNAEKESAFKDYGSTKHKRVQLWVPVPSDNYEEEA